MFRVCSLRAVIYLHACECWWDETIPHTLQFIYLYLIHYHNQLSSEYKWIATNSPKCLRMACGRSCRCAALTMTRLGFVRRSHFLFLACAMLRNDADSASSLPTFVHGFLAGFAVSLRSLNFNDRYDSAFHWIAQSIRTILGQRRSLNARHHDNLAMIG